MSSGEDSPIGIFSRSELCDKALIFLRNPIRKQRIEIAVLLFFEVVGERDLLGVMNLKFCQK